MKLVGSSREETRISSFNLRNQDKTFNFDTKPDKALILIAVGIAYRYHVNNDHNHNVVEYYTYLKMEYAQ